jgi:aryl-alcohol dehydrogenase-like predicted oxidoreductase
MKFSPLGKSDLSVSNVCLGSMTWGLQNTQQDANQQIDYALKQNINFIDTAELYAVPPAQETYGKTEEIIGHWLSKNTHRRKDIVLASKISGKGLPWIRDGDAITGKNIERAVEGSLRRLQTDYIDLFQLHWPNRQFPHFGNHWPHQTDFTQVDTEQEIEGMLDILQGLSRCIDAGKIRYCGLSNDTPWGINTYLKLSEQHNLPRIVSVQNEFNLLKTQDSPYLLENCIRENIAYLPWSPLATGALTGKYLNNARPKGSRWTIVQRNGLFRDTTAVHKASAAYMEVAKHHGITAAQLALAWCKQINGVTSTIIGATTKEQLKENIEAFDIELNNEALEEINRILKMHPMPF